MRQNFALITLVSLHFSSTCKLTIYTFMASIPFSAIGRHVSSSSMVVSNISVGTKLGFFSGKNIVCMKRDARDLTVTKVATELPAIIPSVEKESVAYQQRHVAWTSIRQERWEGELEVEGEIPLWLRNGPGLWHIGDYNFRHLFDGYATLVKLHFANGRLTAGHRQIESEAFFTMKSVSNFKCPVNAHHWHIEPWLPDKVQAFSEMVYQV